MALSRYGQGIVGPLEFDFRIGTVAGADGDAVGHRDGSFDFELVGSVIFYAFRRDVFQYGIEFHVLQGSQGDFYRSSFVNTSHFCFVYVTSEDKVAHDRR